MRLDARHVLSDEPDYPTHMVAHHQEAVAAARQLQRPNRPQMRDLGISIVTTRNAEIATMKNWLAKWYPGRPAAREAVRHSDASPLLLNLPAPRA
ncbi:DUF305 domain-containing protein [Nonomuraea sp. NPDC051941]|uniref:DUF305 domain-containing protein n=1 Tax=Nonomuraea sp. NPDC051941 TaxID=3364373 RepID=UPI0037C93443